MGPVWKSPAGGSEGVIGSWVVRQDKYRVASLSSLGAINTHTHRYTHTHAETPKYAQQNASKQSRFTYEPTSQLLEMLEMAMLNDNNNKNSNNNAK